ncbi:hypothetical protein VOLCADRAFT_103253 [Volvox carteri f. nagariensis]|uniref:ERCC4 domain-containing protein n=1 Tax=Volvox carteri f. nagariensis TaxID=3068 RepID=D8TKI2_VOLCA|nr:uncharacterized protein VOLCADRAFT_103253 [Volvox carteri f. nagariensis]EFJ52250.1 hypothetical protein VOLCADRAFT_103253 [Volvox carteri f. nagariensis]|eukprot:XP_002947024.1 hypothetical protein VOLCADRAFT_103253 [Volvox carteri f. nagariensis]
MEQVEATALSSLMLLPYERHLIEEAIQHARVAGAPHLNPSSDPKDHPAQQQQQQQQPGTTPFPATSLSLSVTPANAAPSTSKRTDATPLPLSAHTSIHCGSGSGIDGDGHPGCVLVLGAGPRQRALITAELARHDPSLEAPVDITNEIPAAERVQLYRALPGGRPLFITPRILVVDLLARRLRPWEVGGLLILNAHRASDTSGEGFAVALLKAEGDAAARTGPARGGSGGGCWVYALSDAPGAFNRGFNRVEHVMKALRLKRLHLWPRFQEHVRQCLDNHKPVVFEWDQELSGPMVLIQAALVEVLEGLIRELRRTNNKLDMTELVLENGVLRAFDEIVRRQLDPIWHTVSYKTRRICTDLRTLRELSALLLSADCVTFLAHLEGLRQSEGVRCMWLFHDATHAIYEQARRRVYIYRQQQQQQQGHQSASGSRPGTGTRAARATSGGVAAGGSSASAGAGAGAGGGGSGCHSEVEAILEEPPKWGLLGEVLGEVQRQRRQLRALAGVEDLSTLARTLTRELRAGAQEHKSTPQPPRTDNTGTARPAPAPAPAAAGGTGSGFRAATGTQKPRISPSSGPRQGQGSESGAVATRGSGGPQTAAAVTVATEAEASPDPELQVEVVDLAASSDASEDGDQDQDEHDDLGDEQGEQGHRAGRRATATAAAPAVADRRPQPPPVVGGSGAGGCGGTPTAQSLRALLEDLGLLGGGEGGGGGGMTSAGGRGSGPAEQRSDAAGGSGVSGSGVVEVTAGDLRVLAEAGRGPVLVVVRELHSTRLLERVVREGGRPVMQQLYESYLLSKLKPTERGRRGSDAAAGGGDGGAAAPGGSRGSGRGRGGGGGWKRYRGGGDGDECSHGPVLRPGEHQALLAEAHRVGVARGEPAAQVRGRGPGRAAKRARLAGGDGGGTGTSAATVPAADASGRQSRGPRGRRGGSSGGSRRQRKPDDSPVRVAAAAAADSEQEEQLEMEVAVLEGEKDEGGAAAGSNVGDRASDDDWSDFQGDEGVYGKPPQSRAAAASYRGRGTAGQGRRNGGSSRAIGRQGRGRSTAAATAAEAGESVTGDKVTARGKVAATAAAIAAAPQPSTAPSATAVAATAGCSDDGAVAGGGHGMSSPAATASDTASQALLQDVHFVSLDGHDEFVLWRLRPSFIIMYEPDLAFLRQRGGGSSNGARGGGGGALSADLWLDVYSANALTRSAGGRMAGQGGGGVGGLGASGGGAGRRLVVDVREFMSSLPAVLYQKGFELLPLTLEVGDYVLSPQLVVERKSLPDLHASLASGRLYNQVAAMCRHYPRPLLLIEFDADRQFGLQSPSELGDDIDPRNVISKLTLLTLHFPKLRLLWSRSPHATADLFAVLKSNQDEPDPAAAALVGVPLGPDGVPLPPSDAEGGGGGGGAGGLRADSNYRAILGHVSSLAELAALPLERLEVIMASSKNARALRDFLDAPCPRI